MGRLLVLLVVVNIGCDDDGGFAEADAQVRADADPRGVVDVAPPPDAAPDVGLADARAGDGPVGDSAPDAAPDAGPDAAPDLAVDAADAAPPQTCPADMVLVPDGVFRFGPMNQLYELPDYCIHRLEVSAAEFLGCVADGACDSYARWPACLDGSPTRPNQCNDDLLDHPANWIDWFRAEQYCRWLGARLPTVPEWEKAARGPDGNVYPWGERADCQRAQYARDAPFADCVGVGPHGDVLAPVESYEFAPSPYGALNLAGNVAEWNEFREDPSELDEEMLEQLPAPARGGSYRDSADGIQAWRVDGVLGAGRSNRGRGFRCAQSLSGQ